MDELDVLGAPIDEERSLKRKKSDNEDDRLDEDDYDLIEENLGVKVQRAVSNEIY